MENVGLKINIFGKGTYFGSADVMNTGGEMTYDLIIRKLPGNAEISRESYTDLGEAMREANFVSFGPSPVEITVVDSGGFPHLTRVVDGEIS